MGKLSKEEVAKIMDNLDTEEGMKEYLKIFESDGDPLTPEEERKYLTWPDDYGFKNQFPTYIDTVKQKLNLKSDRKLAGLIGLSPSTVSNWRLGQIPEDKVCVMIAELVGDDPIQVLAFAHACKTSESGAGEYWKEILKAVSKAPLLLIVLSFIQIINDTRYII